MNTTISRLKSESPDYFKPIIKWCKIILFTCIGITAVYQSLPKEFLDSVPLLAAQLTKWISFIGSISSFIGLIMAKLTSVNSYLEGGRSITPDELTKILNENADLKSQLDNKEEIKNN